MISRYLEAIHLPRCSKISLSLFLYTLSFNLVTRLVIMPPPLTECQLELAKHLYHSGAPEYPTLCHLTPQRAEWLILGMKILAASKMRACEMHACERYVPVRVYLRE